METDCVLMKNGKTFRDTYTAHSLQVTKGQGVEAKAKAKARPFWGQNYDFVLKLSPRSRTALNDYISVHITSYSAEHGSC